MRGNGFHRLAIVVIHLELFLLIGGVECFAAGDGAFVEHELPQLLAQSGVFADGFGHDVARALQRFVDGGDCFLFANECGCECGERQRGRLLGP